MKKVPILILLLCSVAFGQYQKPMLGMQLNPSLTNGLIGCWVMNEGCGNKVYDSTLNSYTGTLGTTLEWVGDGIYYDASTNTDRITAAPDYRHTGGYSFVIHARIDNAGDSNQGRFYQVGALNTMVRFNGSMSAIRIYEDHATTDGAFALTYSFVAYQNYVIVITSTGIAGSIPKFYVNGAPVGVGQLTASVGSITTFTGNLNIGNTNASTRPMGGILKSFYYFNRVLTPEDAVKLSIEPYGMFRNPFELFLYGAISVPAVGGQVIIIGF